jgi:hypothetical protein
VLQNNTQKKYLMENVRVPFELLILLHPVQPCPMAFFPLNILFVVYKGKGKVFPSTGLGGP